MQWSRLPPCEIDNTLILPYCQKEHKCDYGCIVLKACDDVHKLNLIFEFADFSSAVLERAVNMQWDDCLLLFDSPSMMFLNRRDKMEVHCNDDQGSSCPMGHHGATCE